MKGGLFPRKKLGSRGFTIVEVIVVIAVTGALFMGVILMVSGKQDKARFEQAVNILRSHVETTINEVQSGYAGGSGEGCNYAGSTPVVGGTTGSSNNCIFLGKALQFTTGSESNRYAVHTIVGKRDSTGTVNAQPFTFSAATDVKSLWNGLQVASMNGGGVPVSMLAMTLDYQVDADGAATGSQTLRFQPLRGTALTNDFASWSSRSLATELASSPVNPVAGTTICFASGGTNQSVLMTIGAGGSNRVTTEIKQNRTCA